MNTQSTLTINHPINLNLITSSLDNAHESKENFVAWLQEIDIDDIYEHMEDMWVMDWVKSDWTMEHIKHFFNTYWDGQEDHELVWAMNDTYNDFNPLH
ncbi:hypothetical protein D3C73_1194460 [compost metagenome]